jgi:predicted RNA-binding Zn ribbon-like protein
MIVRSAYDAGMSIAHLDLVGGHVALDLLNTVSWRLDPSRRRDNLLDGAALAAWLDRVELPDGHEAARLLGLASKPAEAAAADVRALREDLHALLALVVDAGAPLEELVAPHELQARLTDAIASSRLAGAPMRWRMALRKPADVPRLLALEALDLLQSPHLHRLRRCEGPGCGWLFLDRSRSHTRRWCSSVNCGNRDRARRHYARHRGEAATATDRASAR